MAKKLGIIVPYRDREEHLREFLRVVPAYFAKDARHADLQVQVLIVEQGTGRPFNRGAVNNVGTLLLHKSVDYFCFHDVDALPVDADYSWADQPTMVVMHGLKISPEFARKVLSCVVLLPRDQLLAANGHSNEYWRWGYEDVDLRERLLRCGLKPQHREGVFRSLPHRDLGSNEDGSPSEDAQFTRAIYIARWFEEVPGGWNRRRVPGHDWTKEGLTSLRFTIVKPRSRIEGNFRPGLAVDHVLVDFPT